MRSLFWAITESPEAFGWRVGRSEDLQQGVSVIFKLDTDNFGLMVEINKGGIGVKQVDTALWIFDLFVMKVPTILLVEWHITGDVVVSADENLDSKLCLLEPLDRLLKF